LEDHPDLLAKIYEIDPLVVDVLAVHDQLAFRPYARYEVVHTVYAAKKCAFAAAARSDYRCNTARIYIHRNVLNAHRCAVVKIEVR
jgi:hypothetical protein